MNFINRVTLFFANNFLTECRITIEFLHNFFRPEVILSSHTIFINASTKEFTLIHLVTFSISNSRIRMNFTSSIHEMFMNELIVEYMVATCHYTVAMSCNCIESILSIIISDLQFTTRGLYLCIPVLRGGI